MLKEKYCQPRILSSKNSLQDQRWNSFSYEGKVRKLVDSSKRITKGSSSDRNYTRKELRRWGMKEVQQKW